MDTGREAAITPEEAVSTTEWARSRSRSVVSETVERLENVGEIDIAEPAVSVSIRVTCEACGRSYTIQDLLAAGGCACNRERGGTDGE